MSKIPIHYLIALIVATALLVGSTILGFSLGYTVSFIAASIAAFVSVLSFITIDKWDDTSGALALMFLTSVPLFIISFGVSLGGLVNFLCS